MNALALVGATLINATALRPPYVRRPFAALSEGFLITMKNVEFNNNYYLQSQGTAMGTRIASSYASLFPAKFETDALKRAPQSEPHT